MKVARFAQEIQAERVVCLTATATEAVAKDVCKAFNIDDAGLFRTTTFRSNLKLKAQSYMTKAESWPKLEAFLKAYPGSTIIYVTTHNQAEELAERLRKRGFKTEHFHAGMKTEDKTRVQEKFMASNSLIMCATIAFGMGIDKPDIRNVIHYDIPRSLEGYSQEIGRAGRDGLDSQCIAFLCAEDLHLRETFARGDLPSKNSVFALLQSVFSHKASTGPLPTIETNNAHLSKDFDINATTLGNIMAQLELRFGLLRATTPKYTKYQYKQQLSTERDQTPAARAIRATAKAAKVWTHVDPDAAATRHGVERSIIVSKLNEWHDNRLIEMQPAGVVNIYRVLGKWPPAPAEAQRLTEELYKDLKHREQQALDRMQEVIDMITGRACFAQELANHFGDQVAECGSCTWCTTHVAVEKVVRPKVPWDPKAFAKVLAACKDRDDARYLARIAFGIGSPRVTAAKLKSNPIFGSMENHDFTVSISHTVHAGGTTDLFIGHSQSSSGCLCKVSDWSLLSPHDLHRPSRTVVPRRQDVDCQQAEMCCRKLRWSIKAGSSRSKRAGGDATGTC